MTRLNISTNQFDNKKGQLKELTPLFPVGATFRYQNLICRKPAVTKKDPSLEKATAFTYHEEGSCLETYHKVRPMTTIVFDDGPLPSW